MFGYGTLTGVLLTPLTPLLASVFRSIDKGAARRRQRRLNQRAAAEALALSLPRRASLRAPLRRTPRVEVSSSVDAASLSVDAASFYPVASAHVAGAGFGGAPADSGGAAERGPPARTQSRLRLRGMSVREALEPLPSPPQAPPLQTSASRLGELAPLPPTPTTASGSPDQASPTARRGGSALGSLAPLPLASPAPTPRSARGRRSFVGDLVSLPPAPPVRGPASLGPQTGGSAGRPAELPEVRAAFAFADDGAGSRPGTQHSRPGSALLRSARRDAVREIREESRAVEDTPTESGVGIDDVAAALGRARMLPERFTWLAYLMMLTFYVMAVMATFIFSFAFDEDYQSAWAVGTAGSVVWQLLIISPVAIGVQAFVQIHRAITDAIAAREHEREKEEQVRRRDRRRGRVAAEAWALQEAELHGARAQMAPGAAERGPGKQEVASSLAPGAAATPGDAGAARRRLEVAMRRDLPGLVDGFFRKFYPGDGRNPAPPRAPRPAPGPDRRASRTRPRRGR
jgi:hypothetical protein